MTGMRIKPVAFGLALGIVWGVSVFIVGMLAYFVTYGEPFVTAVGQMYIGYDVSIAGSFIGGLIGFVDAFIGGVIIAWLYNVFAGCCCKNDKCDL